MSSRRRLDSQPSSVRRRRPNAAPESAPHTTEDPADWAPDSGYIEGIDAPPEGESPMSGVGVPAVVAVVATRDPAERFDELLRSLDRQEYANLVTLVIDAGSKVDPTERVAGVLPGAFVKRIESQRFADAANAALGTVDGASFYLFLHDDVVLAPKAVQAMVEEAFRSNAGIVGAKVLRGEDPSTIETVGASIDKFGFLWPIAEEGELDQSQHDAIREAFVVSSAAMLVRCDLFRDLGGFSTDVDGSGEDLDLCWRARVAGARTVVMPAAEVVHHGSAVWDERNERSEHLALRHQARIMLACYGTMSLLRILPQAVVLSILDMFGALLRGRIPEAKAVFGAFWWNVAHLPATLRVRRATQKQRRIPDEEIRRLQIKGSARFTNFFHEYTSRDRSMAQALAAAARGMPGAGGPDGAGPWGVGAVLLTALVLVAGSRSLLGGRVAAVREFVPIGDTSALLREWWTGWRTAGFGQSGGAPTIGVVAWLLDTITLGHTGFARTLLLIAPLAFGAVFAWRLFRGVGSPAARIAALAAYVANPIPYNAISEGRWQALVVWSVAPAFVGRLGEAAGVDPFVRAEGPRPLLQLVMGLGLLLAAATTIAPVAVLLFVVLVVLVAVIVIPGNGGDLRRFAMSAGGALGVSAALHLPWTIAVLGSSNRWHVLLGNSPGRIANVEVSRALMFDTGSHGTWLTAGLLAVLAAAVIVTIGPAFRWILFSLALAVGSFGLVAIAGRIAPSGALPVAEVLLVPAAVGLAVAAGVGVESVRANVIGGAFGLGHLASGIGAIGLLVALLPLGTDVVNGRWNSPTSDIDVALEPLRELPETANSRTLWIGEADAISLHGWEFGDGMRFNVTNGLRPSLSTLFPPEASERERRVADRIRDVLNSETGRLGADLARFGIRYVIVLERLAPLPYGRLQLEVDDRLQERLNQQFDLARLDVAPGIELYENLAASPVWSTIGNLDEVDSGEPADGGSEGSGERTGGFSLDDLDPSALEAVELDGSLGNPLRGEVPGDRRMVVLGGLGEGWRASVEGDEVGIEAVDGAAVASTAAGGRAELSYDAPASQIAMHVVQLLVLAVALVNRRGKRWWLGRARPHDPAMAELLEVDVDEPEAAEVVS